MGRDKWEVDHSYQDISGGTGGGYDLTVVVF